MGYTLVTKNDGTTAVSDGLGNEYTYDQWKSLQPPESPSLLQKAAETTSNAVDYVKNGLTNIINPDYLSQTYNYFSKKSADDNSKVINAADSLGMNAGTLYNTDSPVQQDAIKVAQEKNNQPDWNTLVATNPVTAQFYYVPANMAQSHDDVNAMSVIENIGNTVANSYNLAKSNRELAKIGNEMKQNNQTLEDISDEDNARIQALQSNIKDLQDKVPSSPWSPSGVLSSLVSMAPEALSGAKYIPLGAATGAALGSVIPVAGTIAGATLGAVTGAAAGIGVGFQTGFATEFAKQQSGLSYLNSLEESKYIPISTERAKAGANVSGALTGILSTPLISSWLKIPEIAASSGLLKSLGVTTLENSFIGAGLTASDILGNKIATSSVTDWNGQDIGNIMSGGLDMVPISLAMSIPGYGWAGLHQLGKAVDDTKTITRNPDLVADYIDNVLQNTPIEKVSFDSQQLYNDIDTMNAKDAKTVTDGLNLDPDIFTTDVSTGNDVSANTGSFLVLPEEIRNKLLADVKVNNEPSARDMQQLYDEQNTQPIDESKPLYYEKELNDNADYQKATEESNAKESPTPEQIQSENMTVEEQKQTITKELNESPLYKAEDAFQMNLQLFGDKDVKKIADDYRNDRLSDEQQGAFEQIAEQHGYSSGDKLAKEILGNKLKNEELESRIQTVSDAYKKSEGITDRDLSIRGSMNDASLKKASMEVSAMANSITEPKMSVREDSISKSVDDIAKESDSITKELSSKVKDKNAIKKITDLNKAISDANKEAKYNNRWSKAENKLITDIELGKQQVKNDKVIQTLKDKINDVKQTMKEKISDMEESDKQKMNDRLGALSDKFDAIKKNLDHNIRWYQAESKDYRAKQLARNSDYTVTKAKEIAKNSIERLTIKQAADYKGYFNLAQKCKQQSEHLYRKGDYINALKWKNKEVVNHAMAIKSIQVFKEFKKGEKFVISAQREKQTSYQTIDDFNQAASLLDRFGLKRNDYDKNTKKETLSQWATRQNDIVGNVILDDWLFDESLRMDYTDMKLDDFKSLQDALRNIKAVSNAVKKTLTVQRGANIDTMRSSMINEMNLNKTKYILGKEPKGIKKIKQVAIDGIASLKNLDTLIFQLATDKSKLHDVWIKSVADMANKESHDLHEFKNAYEKIYDSYGKRERNNLTSKKIHVDDLKMDVTKSQLMGIALNLGTEDNKAKLLGTKPVDFISASKWDEPTVLKVLQDNLTEKDWKAVQDSWNLVNSLWPRMAEHHKEFTGFYPEKVSPREFDIMSKEGNLVHMEGGYFPLKPDKRTNMVSAKEMDTNAPLYNNRTSSLILSTKKGFTKARSNANYAISLDPNLISQHICDVIHDMYFRGIVSDLNRVFNQDFRNTLFSKRGQSGVDLFQNYLNDLVGIPYRDVGLDGVNSIVKWMKRSSSNAAIGLRLGVITQNLSNMVLYPGAVKGFGTMDAIYGIMRHGLFDYWPRSLLDWRSQQSYSEKNIYPLSSFMYDRRERPDYSLRELQTGLFGDKYSGPFGDLQQFSAHLMNFTDNLTAIPMWKTAYDMKFKETQNQQKSVEYADMLIRRVNGSPRRYDQSAFMKARPDSVPGLLNSFMGFMTTELNRWIKEFNIGSQSIADKPRLLAFVASRMLLFTLMSDLFSGKTPGDKEDPFKWWMANALEYPFQLFPFARDIMPMFIDNSLGIKSYGYRPPVTFNMIESAANFVGKSGSLIGKPSTGYWEQKQKEQSLAESTTKLASYLIGYPDQMNAWFWNAYDYQQNNMKPQIGDIFQRRPKNERRK